MLLITLIGDPEVMTSNLRLTDAEIIEVRTSKAESPSPS